MISCFLLEAGLIQNRHNVVSSCNGFVSLDGDVTSTVLGSLYLELVLVFQRILDPPRKAHKVAMFVQTLASFANSYFLFGSIHFPSLKLKSASYSVFSFSNTLVDVVDPGAHALVAAMKPCL